MQMGLKSDNVQKVSVYKCVADYMTAKNPQMEVIPANNSVKLVDNFAFAMRAEDTELKKSVDAAVVAMRQDGTLDNLIKTYITNFNPNEEPPAVAMPQISGADTIKVGVTGDLPPLDLVLADGTPAGFNTAVLAEISQRINKNIELVTIESNARAAALTSGTVDVVFWTVTPEGESPLPANSDTPAGVALTNSYYQDVVVDVSLGAVFAGVQ